MLPLVFFGCFIACCLIGFIFALIHNKKVGLVFLALSALFFVIFFISIPSSPKQEEPAVVETEAEKFARRNDIPVELAESLEAVLADMKLTDKSRVGVFHYKLSEVDSWKQVEDWVEGERYYTYMGGEHIMYVYVKDNEVVGIRDSNGHPYYLKENEE